MALADQSSLDRMHQLPDGRSLAWREYGAPGGTPVMYFHGIPGSRIDGRLTAEAAEAAGLRMIAPDRPGFGLSSPCAERRSYSGWIEDVASLADQLGIDRFAVVAYSAGGPYALAACAALPDRITCAAIVSGVAPSEMAGSRKGVAPTNKTMTLLAPRAPRIAHLLVGLAAKQAQARPRWFGRSADRDFSAPADRRILDSELRAQLPELFLESTRSGPGGIVEDFVVLAGPSGFDLGRVSTPLRLWHGEEDRTAPSSHARWIASRVPSAELTIWPGVGHLHDPERWAEVFGALNQPK
jgi:pimeloyl-ACP methyl ester carboxylesterase